MQTKRDVHDKFHSHVHMVHVCCFCTHISSSELCFTSSEACQPMMCPSFNIKMGLKIPENVDINHHMFSTKFLN